MTVRLYKGGRGRACEILARVRRPATGENHVIAKTKFTKYDHGDVGHVGFSSHDLGRLSHAAEHSD